MLSKNVNWSWRDAFFGATIAALGVGIIASSKVESGLPLLFGSLPAAVIGLLPTRKDRLKLVVIGLLFGVSMMLGSFIAQWAIVAVIGMFMLALGSALLAVKKPIGILALSLCLPLVGIGLSYAGLNNSIDVSLLIILGSAVAYLLSLLFPEFKAPDQPKSPLMSQAMAIDYGLRLGLTGATTAIIGFISGTDHIGWIVGAALLVMRPAQEMQELRSIGRITSVFVGALAASWLLSQNLPPGAIAIIGGGTLVGAAATHASRWYITPAFSTFLVFWVLLYGNATSENIHYRFNERVWETILGVGIAYFFGLVIPKILSKRHAVE